MGGRCLGLTTFFGDLGVILPRFHVQHLMQQRVGFVFDGSAAVDRGVHALSIAIAFYPVDDIQASLSASLAARLVNAFDLQGFKEALHRRVVPCIRASAHRDRHAESGGQILMCVTGVLTCLCPNAAAVQTRACIASAHCVTLGRQKSALIRSDIGQPTIRRLARWRIATRNGQPSTVATNVISPIHAWFSWQPSKRRSSKFGATGRTCAESRVTRYGRLWTGRKPCRCSLPRTRSALTTRP